MLEMTVPGRQIQSPTELSDFWSLHSLVTQFADIQPQRQEQDRQHQNVTVQATQRPLRVLIADDDRVKCLLLKEYICSCEHEVVEAVTAGGIAAIQSYARYSPDVVLLDVSMRRLNGFTVCQNLLSRNPNAKIVLMSDRMDENDLSVMRSGATGFLRKPFHLEEVREMLDFLAA